MTSPRNHLRVERRSRPRDPCPVVMVLPDGTVLECKRLHNHEPPCKPKDHPGLYRADLSEYVEREKYLGGGIE